MKKFAVPILVAGILGTCGAALGQTVEMAAKCDKVYKELAEMVKRPDFKDVKQVKQTLGVDVLAACQGPKGKVTCFQCVDKKGLLRTLQLQQDATTGKFALLGYGCRCRDTK